MNIQRAFLKPTNDFLNGVCRHEPAWEGDELNALFLNGVCRHERRGEVH